MAYTIVTDARIEEFMAKVESYLDEDWVLHGPTQVVDGAYFQPLVSEERRAPFLYDMATAYNSKALVNNVNKSFDMGYKPFGSAFCDDDGLIYQPLVAYGKGD